MADAKITELTEDTAPLADDVLPIVDVANTTTKKIKWSTIKAALMPPGTIMAYGGSSAPTGWLLCDGSAVSESTYADLFAVVGHNYGGDPGGGNFNVPNLKGKVPVGYNSGETEFDALGETGGEKTHQLTVAEMPSHHHHVTGSGGSTAGLYTSSSNVAPTDQATTDVGGDGSHNNLQPYLTINYIIKT